MHHLRMLHIITKITFLLFVPIWAFVDFRNILGDETVVSPFSLIFAYSIFVLYILLYKTHSSL